jgi:DNA polymerase-3 subunit epsilon
MREMVRLAERVDVSRCSTALEAAVRELRLIAAEQPRYNRRSRQPRRALWLGLTDEAFPRVTLVREPTREGPWIGPFASAASAEQARDALHEAVALRRCTRRVGPRSRSSPCPLLDMGRCGAPCDGRQSREDYSQHVSIAVELLTSDPAKVQEATDARMARLADGLRFEEAAVFRDRLSAFLHGHRRASEAQGLIRCGEVVAAKATASGGWELACIRHGRLAAAALCRRGEPVQPVIDAMVATAETVVPRTGPTPAALPEETALVLRWLTAADGGPAARLVSLERSWVQPRRSNPRGWLRPRPS